MTQDPRSFDPTPLQTDLVEAREPSVGTKLSVWWLWLCLGLPSSALLFLLVPGYLALYGVEWLEQAEVPLEVWTTLEPWIGLGLLAVAVNHQASFRHRRPAISPGSRSVVGSMWLTGGGVSVALWLGLLGLEHAPRTEILPSLHYLGLSSVLVWTGLTLAWVSGRGVSLILVAVERRAYRSPVFRGALGTAGPVVAIAAVATGGGFSVGLDADAGVDAARAFVADNFESTSASSGRGGSSGGETPSTGQGRGSDQLHACLESLHANGKGSIFWQGVYAIRGYLGVDHESIASETALRVCSRQNPPDNLKPYYLKAVRNRARTEHVRARRLDTCSFDQPGESYRIPTGETVEDCLYERLCELPDPDRGLVVSWLGGETERELADRERIPHDRAKKRRERAKRRFIGIVRRECVD